MHLPLRVSLQPYAGTVFHHCIRHALRSQGDRLCVTVSIESSHGGLLLGLLGDLLRTWWGRRWRMDTRAVRAEHASLHVPPGSRHWPNGVASASAAGVTVLGVGVKLPTS
jgi:hypothetical protein